MHTLSVVSLFPFRIRHLVFMAIQKLAFPSLCGGIVTILNLSTTGIIVVGTSECEQQSL